MRIKTEMQMINIYEEYGKKKYLNVEVTIKAIY